MSHLRGEDFCENFSKHLTAAHLRKRRTDSMISAEAGQVPLARRQAMAQGGILPCPRVYCRRVQHAAADPREVR